MPPETTTISELQLRSVWEGSVDGMLLVDEQGIVLRVNDAYCRMSGLSRTEIEGAHCSGMYHGALRSVWVKWCTPPASTGDATVRNALVEFSNATKGWFDVSRTLIDVPGLPRQLLIVLRDVDERMRASEQLAQASSRVEETASRLEEANASLKMANEEAQRLAVRAEALSKAKSEFLAAMSHEIRTPLHGILGMTELALRTPLKPEQREYLELIQSSADSLLVLLNDVLDYSKAEADRMELNPAPFSLRQMIDSALRPLALRAAARNLVLRYQISPAVPDQVGGDSMRLRQVLLNVVGNAIKFTDHGAVDIAVSIGELDDREAVVHFRVADTGIGIPPESQQAIFQPFRQADSSTTRRYGGTGLGLSISTALIQLMRGRIWVESEPGKGSTFHFTARLQQLPAGAEPPGPPARANSLRILVAEDNPVSRTLLVRMLERMGHRVTAVFSGVEAVDMAGKSFFDAILMDFNMPELDGIEATRQIRLLERSTGRGRQRIFAVTADDAPHNRAQAIEAGIDDILTKPFQETELMRLLDSVLRSPAGESGSAGSPQPLVDRTAALSRTGGDSTLLGEIAALFTEEYPKSMQKIETALTSGDARTVEREAHSLKGSVANFGAPVVVEAALAVEMCARNKDLTDAPARVEALRLVLERLRPELEALASEA